MSARHEKYLKFSVQTLPNVYLSIEFNKVENREMLHRVNALVYLREIYKKNENWIFVLLTMFLLHRDEAKERDQHSPPGCH